MKVMHLITASTILLAGCRMPIRVNPVSAPAVSQQSDEAALLRSDVETLQKMVETLQQSNDNMYVKLEQDRQTALQADERQQRDLDDIKKTIASQPEREDKLKRDIAALVSQRMAEAASTPPAHTKSPVAAGPYNPSAQLVNVKEAQEHIVQPGESLSTIAAAYKVKLGDVMQLNGIKNANIIRPGQKLLIPIME